MRADRVADRYAGDADRAVPTAAGPPTRPIRIGFVVHAMHVAGAEMLVAETIRRLRGRLEATVFTLDAVGKLGEALGAEGIPVICFGRRKGRDLRVGWAMAAEVRRRGIEVLHAHQYTPFFYAALAKILSGGLPRLILTEHGRHYPDTVSWRRRLANRLVLDRLADAVNGVSAFSVASLARTDGFSPGRMEIIENGVDVARYGQAMNRARARTRLGLDPFRRCIVHIARLHPVKDQSTLLKAFAQVAAARDDVDLVLVGEGALREKLEELARTLGVERRVRFLGVRSDVPEILSAADVFVLTSSCEAASLTLLEAMASELPVVVTDVGGNPEIVRHEIEGLLVPRSDVQATAAAIVRLLDTPGLASAMGRAGAERVKARYRLEWTVERYGSLYERLVRSGGVNR